MRTTLRWAIRFALFLTALVVLGTGAASAQDSTAVDVHVPIDICGIGVGLLGDSSADCGDHGAAAPPPPESSPGEQSAPTRPDERDPLPGDVDLDVAPPVDVCGIGVGVLGSSGSECGTEVAGAVVEPPVVQPPEVPPVEVPAGVPPSSGPLGGDRFGSSPVATIDRVARGALDGSVHGSSGAICSWLASTGPGSDVLALAGVGLALLLGGLVSQRRIVPLG